MRGEGEKVCVKEGVREVEEEGRKRDGIEWGSA